MPAQQIGPECAQSHYEGFSYDEDALKLGTKEPKRTTFTDICDLLSTCIIRRPIEEKKATKHSKKNKKATKHSKVTKLVYMLQVDLDFKNVIDPHFIVDDKISWPRVHTYILKHHHYFMDYLFAATRSHSSKGLSLAFSIHPAVLWSEEEKQFDPTKRKFKKASDACQAMLIKAFDIAGCGADWGAKGGGWRLTTNWRLQNRREYFNPKLKKKIESARRFVVSELLSKMNKDPLLKYQRKKDNLNKYLTGSSASEIGFAKLYVELFDNDMTLFCSIKELVKITGLSNKTIKKYLKKEPVSWLHATELDENEGWSLLLKPTQELSQRAFKLLETKVPPQCKNQGLDITTCKHPSQVQKGERNTQITNWILRLKWSGFNRQVSETHISKLVSQIPGEDSSKNTSSKAIKQKCASIFQNSSGGGENTCRVDFPSWLRPSNEFSRVEKNLEDKTHYPVGKIIPFISFPNNPEVECKNYKIGRDLHIQKGIGKFKNRNPGSKRAFVPKFAFFSVPKSEKWRREVCAVKFEGNLLIFSKDKKTFICKHPFVETPNTYVTNENHLEDWTGGADYLNYLKNTYNFGTKIFASWSFNLQIRGYKAIRNIEKDVRNLTKGDK